MWLTALTIKMVAAILRTSTHNSALYDIVRGILSGILKLHDIPGIPSTHRLPRERLQSRVLPVA
jgi:hypothetical protein